MNGRIMIDTGRGGRTLCTGVRDTSATAPVQWVGRALTEELEKRGYETLLSQDVEELNAEAQASGRPALCAALARQWQAHCVLRLCVREGDTPVLGSAAATVHKGDRRAKALADLILRRLDLGSELNTETVRTACSVLLLRRTPCPSVILVLKLPFVQMEYFCQADADLYAHCIAQGIDAWMMSEGD